MIYKIYYLEDLNNKLYIMSTEKETPVKLPQVKLSQTVIVDQPVAFNVLIAFIGIAQKRGAFALDESAKIYECIKMFQEQ
jgi:hypothetical protein